MSETLNRIALGFAATIGLVVAGAIMHVNVTANGGYADPAAVLFIVGAIMVVGGPFLVGLLWNERGMGHALSFIVLAVLLVEGASMIATTKSKLDMLAAKASPAEDAERVREALTERIAQLRVELAGLPETSPALKSARERVARAESTIAERAAERGCAQNCRQLLSKQLDDAQAALGSAQAAFTDLRAVQQNKLSSEIADAEVKLATIHTPATGAKSMRALGISSDLFAAIQAGLIGFGVNLFAAGCLGISGGLLRRLMVPAEMASQGDESAVATGVDTVVPESRAEPSSRSRKDKKARRSPVAVGPALHAPTGHLKHVAEFGIDTMIGDEQSATPFEEIETAYGRWCDQKGCEPISGAELSSALLIIFERGKLPVRDGAVYGLKLAA